MFFVMAFAYIVHSFSISADTSCPIAHLSSYLNLILGSFLISILLFSLFCIS